MKENYTPVPEVVARIWTIFRPVLPTAHGIDNSYLPNQQKHLKVTLEEFLLNQHSLCNAIYPKNTLLHTVFSAILLVGLRQRLLLQNKFLSWLETESFLWYRIILCNCILYFLLLKGTVVAILDACINPDWPYVPVKKGQNSETAWSKLKDKPVQYHFHYRLLDGDQNSRPAGVDDKFKHLEPSCLQLLIDSPHNDVSS